MDEDLLDKFFAGECTPEEAIRVRSSLDQPLANEDLILRRSWRNIQKHAKADSIRPLSPWAMYVAAALAGLMTVFGVAWKLAQENLVIQNTSHHYEAYYAKGLLFKLPPNGSARINMNIASHSADLLFCGDVRIHNTSENDVSMKLNLTCAKNRRPEQSAVVTIRRDKKIVAFQYRLKSDELVVVEEDRVFDLPLPLQKKALEALEI
ncbi:hypothetical protein [Dyadobacter aurulentus]|uniref:hypothetical protein n=1 Tax=Dyadobacter sp. UC 10 TaxID=2605428 RepID=UPI0011F2172F|nr:hypothetical protein [Dyadobacter sp. UC 10]KAA0990160.1 hypothetical protein FXO21_08305 [Dyadobacter sp. UC 10]